jgi:hypothetical protein
MSQEQNQQMWRLENGIKIRREDFLSTEFHWSKFWSALSKFTFLSEIHFTLLKFFSFYSMHQQQTRCYDRYWNYLWCITSLSL